MAGTGQALRMLTSVVGVILAARGLRGGPVRRVIGGLRGEPAFALVGPDDARVAHAGGHLVHELDGVGVAAVGDEGLAPAAVGGLHAELARAVARVHEEGGRGREPEEVVLDLGELSFGDLPATARDEPLGVRITRGGLFDDAAHQGLVLQEVVGQALQHHVLQIGDPPLEVLGLPGGRLVQGVPFALHAGLLLGDVARDRPELGAGLHASLVERRSRTDGDPHRDDVRAEPVQHAPVGPGPAQEALGVPASATMIATWLRLSSAMELMVRLVTTAVL